jgi:hypothetical protein
MLPAHFDPKHGQSIRLEVIAKCREMQRFATTGNTVQMQAEGFEA